MSTGTEDRGRGQAPDRPQDHGACGLEIGVSALGDEFRRQSDDVRAGDQEHEDHELQDLDRDRGEPLQHRPAAGAEEPGVEEDLGRPRQVQQGQPAEEGVGEERGDAPAAVGEHVEADDVREDVEQQDHGDQQDDRHDRLPRPHPVRVLLWRAGEGVGVPRFGAHASEFGGEPRGWNHALDDRECQGDGTERAQRGGEDAGEATADRTQEVQAGEGSPQRDGDSGNDCQHGHEHADHDGRDEREGWEQLRPDQAGVRPAATAGHRRGISVQERHSTIVSPHGARGKGLRSEPPPEGCAPS